MNTIAALFLCIQACLVQSVFGQCLGKHIPALASTAPIVPCGPALAPAVSFAPYGFADFAYSTLPYGLEVYDGIGEGNVAVTGELPVAGITAVAGQVPIMGAVKFGGDVAAAGSVSIAGKCACDCGCADAPYWY